MAAENADDTSSRWQTGGGGGEETGGWGDGGGCRKLMAEGMGGWGGQAWHAECGESERGCALDVAGT